MKLDLLPAAVATLILTGQAVRGVDLAKIERSIRKEPAYQTNAPKYGLLVFGLEAKARAWSSSMAISCTSIATAMAT